MKYVATVEIEFETEGDPLVTIHRFMRKTHHVEVNRRADGKWTRESHGGFVEHYHIVEQPRELK